MATITNFTIDQGSTFTTTIDLDNQAGGLFQLNSYSCRGKIRKSPRSQTYTVFSCSINENSPSQDTITISLSAAQTKKLVAGRYLYDVEIYSSNSPIEVIRILEGQIEILASMTQANPLGQGIEYKYTEENYVAHMMYHPDTGQEYEATTYADHVTYMNLGYVHVYPLGGLSSGSQGALDQAPVATQEAGSDTTDMGAGDTQTSDGGGGAGSGYSY